jgi:thiamine biosynthesis lipoprotein
MAEQSRAGLHRVERVMGIPVGIDVRDHAVPPEALERAFDRLRGLDEMFSTYRPDSEISRLNAGTLPLDDAHPEVREVLDRCEALRARTGGRFDVTTTGGLDPSGFVKGWAVETAAAILAEAGARNLCIHAGGDLRMRGERAAGRPWRVGIQHPHRRDRVAAVLAVRDIAVATSGAYERGAHIIDPRTRRAPEGVLSVTVIGPDLGAADAYATAAFAMGIDGPAWTAGLRGHDAVTILADGRMLSTRGVDRLRLEVDGRRAITSARRP